MTDTLLLSWTKLKQWSDINDSVDPDLIKNNIRLSQDIDLQRVIGTLLYQKLIDLVKAGTIMIQVMLYTKLYLTRMFNLCYFMRHIMRH